MKIDFSSARTMLRWAREEIQNLDSATRAFLALTPYTLFTEPDPKSGKQFIKVAMTTVPDEICKFASHALWDIKHALDHAAFAAVRAVRGDKVGDIHFPIASHPQDLEKKLTHIPLKQLLPRYPIELHGVFRNFEPYPTGGGYSGGGDEFIALSKLANTTKHALALGTGVRPQLLGAQITGGIVELFADNWDNLKQELTIGLLRNGEKLNMNIELACYISFRDKEALQGHDAVEVLNAFVTSATNITDELEACVSSLQSDR